jgi:hypothetical protein
MAEINHRILGRRARVMPTYCMCPHTSASCEGRSLLRARIFSRL